MTPPIPTRPSNAAGGRFGPEAGRTRIGTLIVRSIVSGIEHNASSEGAALAFYTLFSIAPILIIALAIAGSVFGPHTAELDVLAQLRALTGDAGAATVRTLLDSARYSEKRGLAAALGFFTLLIGATSVFAELQNALDRIWSTPAQPRATAFWRFLRSRLLSFGMVLGVGFLLLVSLILSALLAALGNWLEVQFLAFKVVLPLLGVSLNFALTMSLFALIYKYVPRESIAWRDVWVGAAATALLFAVGKWLIGLYLGRSSFSSAYGAAGSLIVLLLWVYYSAQIFLFGAEFTCAYAYARGSRSA